MLFNKPVICSNTSSLPEIVDYADATFDPMSVSSIAECLEKYLSDDIALQKLTDQSIKRSQFLGWERVIDKALQSLLKIRRQAITTSRPTAPTIVCLSATLPSLSGVAIYSHHLITHMARKTDLLHLIDDIPSDLTHLIPGEKRHFPVTRRPSASGAQILVKQQMNNKYLSILGNSPYHIASFEFAINNYAAVWLHDMTILDLVLSRLSQLNPAKRRNYIDKLYAMYGETGKRMDPPTDQNLMNRNWYLKNNITFIEPVINRSEKVIVNSQLAADAISKMCLPNRPSVKILPLAFEKPSCVADKSLEPTIVTLGWVSINKRPRELIEMLALIDAQAQLVFVGPVDKGLRDNLLDFAKSLSVSDQVTFTGALSTDDYWRWCHRAWIGIQLRSNNNGESSATVRDFMAARTPVITEVASAADTPDNAISYIPDGSDINALTHYVSRLLRDQRLRDTMGQNGYLYVSSNTFDRISHEIIDFLLT
jgi:glycosyltransferase involved in cell wall biosynthesis